MSNKENPVLTRNVGRYPFKAVSDEYFENLTARIMERIPDDNIAEQDSDETTKLIDIRRARRRNLWVSAISIAASLILIATIALKFLPKPTTATEQTNELTAEYTNDDYNEALMTYTMVDNMDVYCYLSEEELDE